MLKVVSPKRRIMELEVVVGWRWRWTRLDLRGKVVTMVGKIRLNT